MTTETDPKTTARGGDEDVELLFCSNCRVSVPQSDLDKGVATMEYGSLLCRTCAPADPVERAARRDAIESELATDLDDLPSPVAVPAQSTPSTSRDGPGTGFAVLLVVVVGLFLVAGIVAASLLGQDERPLPEDYGDEVAALRESQRDLRERVGDLEDDNAKLRDERGAAVSAAVATVEDRLSDEVRTLASELAELSRASEAGDRAAGERLAKVEGALAEIAEQVRALTANLRDRGSADAGASPGPSRADASERPVDDAPPSETDPVKPPNPRVVQLMQDLLDENQEDSVRFPAATELGKIGDPLAIPALAKALLTDDHFLVRRACARSLGSLKAWNAVPALIEALQDKEAYVAQQASYALQSITGQDFGVTQDQAQGERKRRARTAASWWEENRDNPPDGVSLESADL